MKRSVCIALLLALSLNIAAASLSAGPGTLSFGGEKLILSTDGISFSALGVTHGNIGRGSLSSLLSDPYDLMAGISGSASLGVSGIRRATSLSLGNFSLMAVAGASRELSFSYDGKYFGAAVLYRTGENGKKGYITDWNRFLKKDIFALAVRGRYDKWIDAVSVLTFSPAAGFRGFMKAESTLGPFFFHFLHGGTVGQANRWNQSRGLEFRADRFSVKYRAKHAEQSGYTEKFTPFEGETEWSLLLGGVTVGTSRRLRFDEDAGRKKTESLFIRSEKLEVSLSTGFRIGLRTGAGIVKLGVREGGVWVRLELRDGGLVLFSEEGKLGIEITVEFPEE